MKKCPYCAEEIKDEAMKCKHCFKSFSNGNDSNQAPSSRKEEVSDKNKRSFGVKFANGLGILFFVSGVYALIFPYEGMERKVSFTMMLFGATLTDYYVPFIRGKVSDKWLARLRVLLPLAAFVIPPTIVGILSA